MPVCERCGSLHDWTFGSGRFCSRSCANARTHSESTRLKISKGVKSSDAYIRQKQISDLKLEEDRKRKESKIRKKQEFLESVKMSEHMKILTYPGLDFGDRYVITDSGVVIISETQQPMKTFHRTDDIYMFVYV